MIFNVLFTLAVLFPSMSIAFALTEADADSGDAAKRRLLRGGTSHDSLGVS